MNDTQTLAFITALMALSFGGGVLALKAIQKMRNR